MIHELYANNDKFKAIKFKKGLNIVLADTIKNNRKDSRNGLGKTTLINLIHFCLGSKNFKRFLPTDKLKDWEFTISLDLSNKNVKATRSFANPSQIKIEGDDKYISIDEWNDLLSRELFGFIKEDGFKYSPSYRTLIHYFIRSNNDFKSVFVNENSSFNAVIPKVSTSFLMNLNWRLISKQKELSDRYVKIKSLTNQLKENYGTRGRIIPEINRLKKETGDLLVELDNFKIHKSYDTIKLDADRLTEEIHNLINEKFLLENKLKLYSESNEEESIPDDFNFGEIYEKAGLIFTKSVKHTFDESKKFHETILKNRKEFLENEIISITTRIDEINTILNKKTAEKSQYMDVLNNFGALKEYTNLQEIYLDKKQNLIELKDIIDKYDENNLEKQNIKNQLVNLERDFKINYDENQDYLNYLINLFSENSSKLYNRSGNLIIELNDKGFDFNIEIPRLKSDGKSKMIIFCYDLMLLEAFCKKHIDFLIHDSTVFNGVDSRQIVGSLNLAYEKCQNNNVQYICMLNSDMIDSNFLDFNLDENIVLELNDDNITNSLLGFEF